jgi:hypothetical protein
VLPDVSQEPWAEELLEVICGFDADEDGILSHGQLLAFVRQLVPPQMSAERAAGSLLEQADMFDSGFLGEDWISVEGLLKCYLHISIEGPQLTREIISTLGLSSTVPKRHSEKTEKEQSQLGRSFPFCLCFFFFTSMLLYQVSSLQSSNAENHAAHRDTV